MTAPSMEQLLRLLEEGCTESDVELAYRLRCKRSLIARARASLGMPPMPLPVFNPGLTEEQRAMLGALLTSGGHRRWVGRRTGDGVPILDNRTTVARVMFRITYGREPVGQARVGCAMKHCVEGSHLVDRLMREELGALDLAGGVR
ncbi:hypothetical protein [Streptomyces sp. AMCC400023]|uniref:hypothetical protein n=1 Tax=Streptomyces sp. AMCC400023 TaxID=2056258 RepID=UPI001F475996|nr:hypothetical protein [Streptomyces sp. AMCC400023]UJV42915.1 hypothetical protein CVT30_26510 [Streptomyces sp. AMCC400023]